MRRVCLLSMLFLGIAIVKPLEAFRELTGQPLGKFEEDFHRYLGQLRNDGTAPMVRSSPGRSQGKHSMR